LEETPVAPHDRPATIAPFARFWKHLCCTPRLDQLNQLIQTFANTGSNPMLGLSRTPSDQLAPSRTVSKCGG
jgi:hypothetical protein